MLSIEDFRFIDTNLVLYFGITLDKRDDEIVKSFRALFNHLQSHSTSKDLLHRYMLVLPDQAFLFSNSL